MKLKDFHHGNNVNHKNINTRKTRLLPNRDVVVQNVCLYFSCLFSYKSFCLFHGFGGLFLYGNSSVWLPCGDHTPHKDCPVLWPQQHCLGGSRGLEVKICVQCALLPHKTYLHRLTRILKHPTIFSELVKEQRKMTNITLSCSSFRKTKNPSFCICWNPTAITISPPSIVGRVMFCQCNFPSVFLCSDLWVKAAKIKRALQGRLTGNTLRLHMNASLCAKCRLCLDCNDKTEELVWREMNAWCFVI